MAVDEKRHSFKAPGRADRRGISLVEFFNRFSDDLAAEAWVESVRWPNGPVCYHCGSIRVSRVKSRKPMPFRCKDCRKHFSVKYGTIMQGSPLGVQTWILAVYLLTTGLKGTSSLKLRRDLGVTQKTAWFLAHRIRVAMDRDGGLFAGPVEVDETFIGGREINKHADKRIKAGGGTVGKTAVFGAKDRATGKISAKVVPDVRAATLLDAVSEVAEPGAVVYTDEWNGYARLRRRGYDHEKVKHSVSQWVDGMAHTNGIESVWSLFKRGYHGTYHSMSKEHLGRYVSEFECRHNDRLSDTEHQMAEVVRHMEGRLLPYQQLIASGPHAKAKMEA